MEALRRDGEQKLAAVRSGTEREAQRLRAEASVRREEIRSGHEREHALLCASRLRDIMSAAERKSALVRLGAEHALSIRLRERAVSCLKRLRGEGGDELFRGLATELPEEAWGTVRVNRADEALARALFPAAIVAGVDGITGGLEATTGDASFTVVNTLDVRLERAWAELLPRMMADLRGKTE